MVPDRADTWTRMVYAGPNKPIAPIDDPYQMFAKLYGRIKDQESLKSVLDDLAGRPEEGRRARSAPRTGSCSRSTPPSSARWSRSCKSERRPDVGHAVPELEPGVKEENDNIPKISKMQIDLMVNSFAADFARVATLQYTNSVGGAGCAGSASTKGTTSCRTSRTATTEVAGEADQDQQLVLRAARLPGQAPGRDARAGRRRQPARRNDEIGMTK